MLALVVVCACESLFQEARAAASPISIDSQTASSQDSSSSPPNERELRSAIRNSPLQEGNYLALAAANISAGKLNVAEQVLKQGLSVCADRDGILKGKLSELLLASGRFEEATAHFSQFLTQNPLAVQTYREQYRTIMNNRVASTDGLLANALAMKKSGNIGISRARLLAGLYLFRGQTNEAVAMLDSIVADNPHEPVLLALRGELLLQNGRADEGIQELEQAIRLQSSARWIATLVDALRINGRIPEAEAWMKKALMEDPGDVSVQWSLARLNQDTGNLDAAEIAYKKALLLARDNLALADEAAKFYVIRHPGAPPLPDVSLRIEKDGWIHTLVDVKHASAARKYVDRVILRRRDIAGGLVETIKEFVVREEGVIKDGARESVALHPLPERRIIDYDNLSADAIENGWFIPSIPDGRITDIHHGDSWVRNVDVNLPWRTSPIHLAFDYRVDTVESDGVLIKFSAVSSAHPESNAENSFSAEFEGHDYFSRNGQFRGFRHTVKYLERDPYGNVVWEMSDAITLDVL